MDVSISAEDRIVLDKLYLTYAEAQEDPFYTVSEGVKMQLFNQYCIDREAKKAKVSVSNKTSSPLTPEEGNHVKL